MMNREQQKLLDDARMLHRFLKQNRSGSTLLTTIQRFMDNPDRTNERALRKDIHQELEFLKSLRPVYALHNDWLNYYRERSS